MVVAGTALAERAARQADHAATGKRNADSHHAGASVGVQPGEGPGDRRTPVVAHHESLLRTIGVEDAHDVANQFLDAVGLLHPVFRRAAIPALVDGHHAVARAGKRGNLMPPRVPGLRKPVQQHHQRSLLVGWLSATAWMRVPRQFRIRWTCDTLGSPKRLQVGPRVRLVSDDFRSCGQSTSSGPTIGFVPICRGRGWRSWVASAPTAA